jgi:hypothetical protein
MRDIKPTISKIKLDDAKADEIRSRLVSQKRVTHVWVIPVAAVLTLLIILMAVPYTRNAVVNAAEKIYSEFCIKGNRDDSVLILGTDPETGKSCISLSMTGSNDSGKFSLMSLKDGRLILDFGDVSIDITDECSRTKYYRKAFRLENGDEGVIFAGGVPEPGKYGVIVYLKQHDPEHLIGLIDLPEDAFENGDFEWANKALHDEGMECLDPDCRKCSRKDET